MNKVKPSEDAFGQLKLASSCIARAIDALLGMDSSMADCPAHLQSADTILRNVNQGAVLADRDRLEPLLQSLTGQSAATARLLESAASLRFGIVLSTGGPGACYKQDGSCEGHPGGRSLLLEG